MKYTQKTIDNLMQKFSLQISEKERDLYVKEFQKIFIWLIEMGNSPSIALNSITTSMKRSLTVLCQACVPPTYSTRMWEMEKAVKRTRVWNEEVSKVLDYAIKVQKKDSAKINAQILKNEQKKKQQKGK